MRHSSNLIKLLLILAYISFAQLSYGEELSADNKLQETKASALRSLSTQDLISILSDEFEGSIPCDKKPDVNNEVGMSECDKLAESELIRRAPVKELLNEMEQHGWFPRIGWAARILGKIGGVEAEAGLRKIAVEDTSESGYFALMHFANSCQEWALSRLNANGQMMPSYIWADTLSRFGDCGFKPATGTLVTSMNAASLNLVGAACDSLKKLYPEGPECTLGPPEDQRNWVKWLNQNDIKF